MRDSKLKLGPAAKLALVQDMVKRREIHVCPDCGQEHSVELGMMTIEEARKLLDEPEPEKPDRNPT